MSAPPLWREPPAAVRRLANKEKVALTADARTAAGRKLCANATWFSVVKDQRCKTPSDFHTIGLGVGAAFLEGERPTHWMDHLIRCLLVNAESALVAPPDSAKLAVWGTPAPLLVGSLGLHRPSGLLTVEIVFILLPCPRPVTSQFSAGLPIPDILSGIAACRPSILRSCCGLSARACRPATIQI